MQSLSQYYVDVHILLIHSHKICRQANKHVKHMWRLSDVCVCTVCMYWRVVLHPWFPCQPYHPTYRIVYTSPPSAPIYQPSQNLVPLFPGCIFVVSQCWSTDGHYRGRLQLALIFSTNLFLTFACRVM